MLVEPDMEKVNAVLKRNDWNDYTVICRGPNIKIVLNGVEDRDNLYYQYHEYNRRDQED